VENGGIVEGKTRGRMIDLLDDDERLSSLNRKVSEQKKEDS